MVQNTRLWPVQASPASTWAGCLKQLEHTSTLLGAAGPAPRACACYSQAVHCDNVHIFMHRHTSTAGEGGTCIYGARARTTFWPRSTTLPPRPRRARTASNFARWVWACHSAPFHTLTFIARLATATYLALCAQPVSQTTSQAGTSTVSLRHLCT